MLTDQNVFEIRNLSDQISRKIHACKDLTQMQADLHTDGAAIIVNNHKFGIGKEQYPEVMSLLAACKAQLCREINNGKSKIRDMSMGEEKDVGV